MELRHQLLESFTARGSDARDYKVRAYDRLALVPGSSDSWESTGVVEYRLEDGRLVDAAHDGTLRVTGTDIVLNPGQRQAA